MSLEDIRTDVRDHLGIDENDRFGSDIEIDKLINASKNELYEKFDFREKESTYEFATVDGTREYTVPADYDSLESMSIVDSETGEHTELIPKEVSWYESNYNEGEDYEGKPEYYIRRADEVWLLPTPDAEYEVVMHYDKLIPDLSSSGFSGPPAWVEILTLGAIHRGFRKMKDFESSNRIRKDQLALIESTSPTKAKEQTDYNRSAGLDVLREDNY